MNKSLKFTLKIVATILLFALLFCAVYGLVEVVRYRVAEKRCETERAIPRVDVITEGEAEIVSKEDYVNCTVTVSGTEINAEKAGIRGRGNTTWEFYPKKPYRIKFEEKVSVFGEKANKSWVLLALYNDFSAVKDRLAFTMADALGTDVFVPSYNYVELYLNGEYNGLYLMTDQVDENKGRAGVKTDVDEMENADDVPFLVELDDYAPNEGVEGVDWFSVAGHPYNIKYPERDERNEEIADEQFNYIKNYVQRVQTACEEGDYETFAELVDVDSFIDFYIVQEVMGQPELNWKSVYMHKAVGEKMKMGPVWDFDWGAMGPGLGEERNMYRDDVTGLRSSGNWFDLLLRNSPKFEDDVRARYAEAKPLLLGAIEAVRADEARLAPYLTRNHIYWHWFRVGTENSKYYGEVLDWCTDRITWLEGYFAGI
jgi:hypothetical protein